MLQFLCRRLSIACSLLLVHRRPQIQLDLKCLRAFFSQEERARALCEALELVLERVHAVRVDTANNRLRAIAPVIRDHGVEYERSHFEKKLGAGKITLALSEQWIRHTINQILASSDPRVSREKLKDGAHQDFETVLYVGMVDLVVDYPHWGGQQRANEKEHQVPETIHLDSMRIEALNALFHIDVVCTILLATVDHEVKCRLREGIIRSQLLKSVSDAVLRTPPRPDDAKKTIRAVLDELVGKLSEQDIAVIETLVDKNIKRTHPVYAHMVSVCRCIARLHARIVSCKRFSQTVTRAC